MKYCLSVIIIFYTFQVNAQRPTNKEYVRLFYGGIIDKPIPQLILSVDSFYTDELWFYGIRVRLSKCELYAIQSKLLLNNSFKVIDSLNVEFYNIELRGVGEENMRGVGDKKSAAKLFDQILQEIVQPLAREQMTSYIEMVLSRIR